MARRLAAEFLGTAWLLVAIVGSGITASVDGLRAAEAAGYVAVQAAGALVGVVVTNAMFAQPLVVPAERPSR